MQTEPPWSWVLYADSSVHPRVFPVCLIHSSRYELIPPLVRLMQGKLGTMTTQAGHSSGAMAELHLCSGPLCPFLCVRTKTVLWGGCGGIGEEGS